jgi:hypothetical protein
MTSAILLLLAWNALITVALFYSGKRTKRSVGAVRVLLGAHDQEITAVTDLVTDLGKVQGELGEAVHTGANAMQAHQRNHQLGGWMTLTGKPNLFGGPH